MKRKTSFLPAFLAVSFLCVLILALSLSGNLKFLSSFLEKGTSAVQSATFGVFHKLPFVSESVQTKKLKDNNLNLVVKLSEIERLKKENSALRDQFQTSNPKSYSLMPANIIGSPSFIPGITAPTNFILDKGQKDKIKVGLGVVFKNNLIGKVVQTSSHLSKVELIMSNSSSFTAKTENGAQGIVKGGGGSLILGNVLLSENIKEGELVLTKGDIDSNGIGIPQDLIVGKITEIEKNPSDLFQKAKIESFVDFARLSTVFVYIEY